MHAISVRLFEPVFRLYFPEDSHMPPDAAPPCVLCNQFAPPARLGWMETKTGGSVFLVCEACDAPSDPYDTKTWARSDRVELERRIIARLSVAAE